MILHIYFLDHGLWNWRTASVAQKYRGKENIFYATLLHGTMCATSYNCRHWYALKLDAMFLCIYEQERIIGSNRLAIHEWSAHTFGVCIDLSWERTLLCYLRNSYWHWGWMLTIFFLRNSLSELITRCCKCLLASKMQFSCFFFAALSVMISVHYFYVLKSLDLITILGQLYSDCSTVAT